MWDRPEVGGVIIEDMVLVTESGHEKLTELGYEQKLLAEDPGVVLRKVMMPS